MTNLTQLKDQEFLKWIRENNRLESNSLIPDSYLCTMCKKLLIDPIQTDCGCRYCRICYAEYYGSGNRRCVNVSECGNDAIDSDITCDKAASRDILRMNIKCPFYKCNVFADVKNIKSHTENCEHAEEECNMCKIYYPKREKTIHLKEICAKRKVQCKWCKTTVEYDNLTTDHFNIESSNLCLQFEGNCPYGCGLVVLFNHKNVCERRPVECPFPDCSEKSTKKSLNEHLTVNNYKHLISFLEQTRKQNLDIENLENQVRNKTEEIQILKEKYNDIKKNQQTIERRISTLPKNNSRNTGVSMTKIIFRKGTFVWKIENIVKLKIAAESGGDLSKFSDPFYSSEFGYKLCIKIYPAGDGIGARNYLSIYFVVMKGDYDELLSWPFKNKVTLSLLSQGKNQTENFKPDPMSACYQRPTDEYNVASGSPKFLKLEELPKFTIDGSIFIRMVVIPN